jgi:hypothetical protein
MPAQQACCPGSNPSIAERKMEEVKKEGREGEREKGRMKFLMLLLLLLFILELANVFPESHTWRAF